MTKSKNTCCDLEKVSCARPPGVLVRRDFTHGDDFTGYMEIVFHLLEAGPRRQKSLDIPAGNGLLAARFCECGHTALCADINQEKPDFVFADMTEPLPFAKGEFDSVVCM